MPALLTVSLGFPLSEIAHLRYYTEEVRNGAYAVGAPTDHVHEVTGREPEDFETIARRYIRSPELIHPSSRVGSMPAALGLLLRMLMTRSGDLRRFESERGYPLLRDPFLAHESAEWRRTAERREANLLPLEAAPRSAYDPALARPEANRSLSLVSL